MRRLQYCIPVLLGLTLTVVGCVPPDDDGGSAPPPSGLIRGTVLYVGQRPLCVYEDGAATEVIGNVVLLMFRSDNPPPPSGTATSAENLLLIPAQDMFGLEDCMPESPTPEDLRTPVSRGASFSWPEIALARGEGVGVDYQVRGFFDRDQDFNPFFSVRRLATKGDVAGGAFVNTAANPPQFSRIAFGSVEDRSNGQVVEGVAVTLGAVVNTELPAFELTDGTRGLSSEARVPAISDAVMREQALWDLTEARFTLIDPTETSWVSTLEAAGMSIDPHPSGYGWFTMPVDGDRDGEQDLHPILGPSGGVLWTHPIVIMRRARNPFELLAGIPDVVVLGSVRPTQLLSKDTFDPEIDIAVPPIAAVNLDPTNPSCNIPYIAPGNLAEVLERIPVDCQELPTGNYDVNALAGIAGGTVIDYRAQLTAEMPDLPASVIDTLVGIRTDSGWLIEGGSYSSQAWSIPNELGCPDPYRPNARDEDGNPITVSQLDEDPLTNCGAPTAPCDASGTLMQCSQGPAGRFSIVDPDGSNAPDHTDTSDGHGAASCQTTIRGSTMMADTVTYMPVPEACCAAVAHLCGLPLCSLRDGGTRPLESGARAIREMSVVGTDYALNEDGTVTPLCLPFLMPASCCR